MRHQLHFLLFILLLTSAVGAQDNWGSGSLVATLTTDGIITLSISSESLHQQIRYAPAQDIQRAPIRFRGYEPYPFGGWGDWRVVHQKVNELTRKGWELSGTNMSTSGGGDCGPILKHLHYHFYVPEDAPRLRLNPRDSAIGRVVLEATINQGRDFGRQRGALRKKPDGTYVLTVERFQGDDFYPTVTIEGEGVVGGDLPSYLEAIEISGRRLILEYAMESGRYRYEFIRNGDTYPLTGLQFTANGPCGLQELRFNNANDVLSPITQYLFRTAPCDGTEPPERFNTRLNIGRHYLQSFTPMENKVPLENQTKPLTF